jgi:hypothetical protein
MHSTVTFSTVLLRTCCNLSGKELKVESVPLKLDMTFCIREQEECDKRQGTNPWMNMINSRSGGNGAPPDSSVKRSALDMLRSREESPRP